MVTEYPTLFWFTMASNNYKPEFIHETFSAMFITMVPPPLVVGRITNQKEVSSIRIYTTRYHNLSESTTSNHNQPESSTCNYSQPIRIYYRKSQPIRIYYGQT